MKHRAWPILVLGLIALAPQYAPAQDEARPVPTTIQERASHPTAGSSDVSMLSYSQREARAGDLEEFVGGNIVGLAVVLAVVIVVAVVLIVWILVPWK